MPFIGDSSPCRLRFGPWFSRCRTGLQLTLIVIAMCVPALPARAVNIVLHFEDEIGSGFLDPVLGATRRDALQRAGDAWGRLILPSYAGEKINVRAKFDTFADEETIAAGDAVRSFANFDSSSPAFFENVYYPAALANHLAHSDMGPDQDEVFINFNIAKNFHYGSGNPNPNQIDFVSVAAHELGHGLGFSSNILENGAYGALPERLPAAYDLQLVLGQGGTPLPAMSMAQRAAATLSSNMYWGGANGAAGNMGAPPKMFAPSEWYDGSSLSHLDLLSMTGLMTPVYDGVKRTVPTTERGMMRDMGWKISVAAQQITWSGAGSSSQASSAANWTPQLPVPGDSLHFVGNGPYTTIDFDLVVPSLGEMTFSGAAPAHVISMAPQTHTALTGFGIVNQTPNQQTFVLNGRPTPFSAPGEIPPTDAARLRFVGNATSGTNTRFELEGGKTGLHQVPNLPPSFERTSGAYLSFEDNASAGGSSFLIGGSRGDGAPQAKVVFLGNASASAANFHNKAGLSGISLPQPLMVAGLGGVTEFRGTSRVGISSFLNDGVSENQGGFGGSTFFTDEASADHGLFINMGATIINGGGGVSQFMGHSTADEGTFTNHGSVTPQGTGVTFFGENSTADNATITNKTGGAHLFAGGVTRFRGNSTAGFAQITNEGGSQGSNSGVTHFHDLATAGFATITHGTMFNGGGIDGGRTEFHDHSSAGSAALNLQGSGNNGGGHIYFRDDSTAGNAQFNIAPLCWNGGIGFLERASADNGTFMLQNGSQSRINFLNDSTAGTAHFDIGSFSAMTFIERSNAGSATMRFRDGSTGSISGTLVSTDPMASLGTANITVDGASTAGSFFGAALYLGGYSTAGGATITTKGGSVANAGGASTRFSDGARAGISTLVADSGVAGAAGGNVQFVSGAKGDSARLVANAGGVFDFTGNRNTPGGTEVGSIEGAGTYILNSPLTTGNLNTSTTVSGQLIDALGFGTTGSLTKVGTGTLILAGANTYGGATTAAGGTVFVNGSIIGGAVVKSGATLGGNGTISGGVTVEPGGTLAPGNTPGTITLDNLTLQNGSNVEFELGTIRDHIVVNGALSLAGTLNISVLGGFTPLLGEVFPLFDGTIASRIGAFATVNSPTFGGRRLDVVYSAGEVRLQVIDAAFLPGDFNHDNTVDTKDYVVWRKGFGAPYGQHHYNEWRAHFGQSLGGGSGSTAIPEPAFAGSFIATLMGLVIARRNRGC